MEFDLIGYVYERCLPSLRQRLVVYVRLIDRLAVVWK